MRPRLLALLAHPELAGRSAETIAILRAYLVQGVPIGMAVDEVTHAHGSARRNRMRAIQRLLAAIGWGS